jgi:hypothetical protein
MSDQVPQAVAVSASRSKDEPTLNWLIEHMKARPVNKLRKRFTGYSCFLVWCIAYHGHSSLQDRRAMWKTGPKDKWNDLAQQYNTYLEEQNRLEEEEEEKEERLRTHWSTIVGESGGCAQQ